MIFSKNYRQEVPFAPGSGDSGALTEAYGKALSAILNELETDLRSAVKQGSALHPPKG